MTHTFDIHISYERCPKCGKIIEARQDYVYRFGKYVKEIVCPRCHTMTTLEKTVGERPLGPLFGNPPNPEFDWS